MTISRTTSPVLKARIDNWAGGLVTANDDTFNGNWAPYVERHRQRMGQRDRVQLHFQRQQRYRWRRRRDRQLQPRRHPRLREQSDRHRRHHYGHSSRQGGQRRRQSRTRARLTLTLQNTIVAGNTASSNPDVSGSITTDKDGNNLLGIGPRGHHVGQRRRSSSDTPLLAMPLERLRRPTQTMASAVRQPGNRRRQQHLGGPGT